MVQLQADVKKFEDAGVQIVAVSYDSVDVLAKFAEERKITFPLLSDPESKTIKAFDILNKEATSRAAGVPYPGTFIIDSKGVVQNKIFLDGYSQWHTTDELLKAADAKVDVSKK